MWRLCRNEQEPEWTAAGRGRKGTEGLPQLGPTRQPRPTHREAPFLGLPSQRSFYCLPFHLWLWELDQKEGWALKNWCFWTMVLEKTLESPLVSKEIRPVNPKGNQPWIFIGRTDAEAEALILWPPDAKSQFIGKDPDAGKDWGQEEKRAPEDEMVGWHHRFNRHELG